MLQGEDAGSPLDSKHMRTLRSIFDYISMSASARFAFPIRMGTPSPGRREESSRRMNPHHGCGYFARVVTRTAVAR